MSPEPEPEDEDFTDEQKAEIDRRLAAYEATGRTVTWEEFLTAARARSGGLRSVSDQPGRETHP